MWFVDSCANVFAMRKRVLSIEVRDWLVDIATWYILKAIKAISLLCKILFSAYLWVHTRFFMGQFKFLIQIGKFS